MHMWQLILGVLVAAGTGCGSADSGCSTSSDAQLIQLATSGDMSEVRLLGLKGETNIEVLVGVRGGDSYMAEAKIVRSSGAPLLDRAAMYAVRYSTFEPALCNGVPVPGKVVVKVALP